MADFPSKTSESELPERLATMERDLDTLRNEVEHAQRLAAIGTIAAGVAHEINNLLTPVLGYLQLLESCPEDQDIRRKAIDRSLSGIEAAAQVTRAMLDFSASDQEPPLANIAEALGATLDCLARDPAKDGIAFSSRVLPGLFVKMRPTALQQVLLNLILNACRVMRGRGGELRVEAANEPDATTIITVADTGPGIPEDIADRLFEPFVRSGKADESGGAGRGSGLGLAVCKQLVEAAGGRIKAESTPGRGATFTIIVPTHRAERAKAG